MTFSLITIAAVILSLTGVMAHGNNKRCRACQDLSKAVERNLEKTKDRTGTVNLANGRSVPYARSETRLGDILKGVCKGADYPEECNDIVSVESEAISKWFYSQPRGDFAAAVCKPCKSATSSSDTKCKCPFAKWCKCSGMCSGKCCLWTWMGCAKEWLWKAKTRSEEYGQVAIQQARQYSRLANQHLDKVPISNLVERVPYLNRQQKKFVVHHWKTIALTALLLILTPLYYVLFSGTRQPVHLQRSSSRVSSRRPHRAH